MAHPTSYPMGTGGSFPGVKATTHLQLVTRQRKCGYMHPLPLTPSWNSACLVMHRDDLSYIIYVWIIHLRSTLYMEPVMLMCTAHRYLHECNSKTTCRFPWSLRLESASLLIEMNVQRGCLSPLRIALQLQRQFHGLFSSDRFAHIRAHVVVDI
jgi:hypothetical protein